MMKNIGQYALISIVFLCVGLMLGIFIGQGKGGTSITLIPSDVKIIDRSPQKTVYKDSSTGRININTASVDELISVPGVGKVTAERIISYRNTYGLFYSVNDLLKISGIGEKTLEKMKPYITVGG